MDYIYGAGVQQMIDAAQCSADIDAVNAAWQRTADILTARITERDARIAQLEQEVMRLTPSIFAPNTTELQNQNNELTKTLNETAKKLDEATKSLAKINEWWDAESWASLRLMSTLVSQVVPALAESFTLLEQLAQAPDSSSRIQAHLAMLAEAMREYMAERKGSKHSVFALPALRDACGACRDALRVEINALAAAQDS